MGACLEAHGQTGDPETITDLSPAAYTVLDEREGLFVRKLCMHCLDPTCVSVCPVGALRKLSHGPVTYEASRCLGCRYCIQACPFGVPRYEWDRAVPAVAKCDFCAPRLERGELPACVEACPVEAAVFGDRGELLAEAHRRIAADPGAYHPRVYGESEIGGTSVLFLSPVAFEELGFPGLESRPLSERTGEALAHVPDVISVGGAFLLAIWWITQRREKVAREEAIERGDAAPEALAPADRRSADASEEGSHEDR
jgi:formate dehydrogenase iron-sulfur subunit